MEIYAETAMGILDELHTERLDYHSEYVPLADAINRLAAYEETRLEPEDMKKAFNEDATLKLTGQALGMSPDRLRELAQAEKEGRLVVLEHAAKKGERNLHAFTTIWAGNFALGLHGGSAMMNQLTDAKSAGIANRPAKPPRPR